MAQVLESLRAEFHDRAVALTDYNEGAATAFRADAGRIDTELNRYLDEPLAIKQAAAEFRWDYEALRRRLRRDSLTRTELNGRRVVTRRTMIEVVGYGRGPRQSRSTGKATAEQATPPTLDPDLLATLVRKWK